ncbi:MAG: orotidine-5'-phosphate decarboxylase [Thermoleophilia bacterium]
MDILCEPMSPNFADNLIEACTARESQLCVGLDPRLESMPAVLLERYRRQEPKGCGCGRKEVGALFTEFGAAIIDAVAPHAAAVKIQSACYEPYGPAGIKAFKHTCDRAAKAGLMVIADAKRGDIGVSAAAYSAAYLGRVPGLHGPVKPFNIDALTVNPLFGTDGIEPFLADCRQFGKGIFILLKTSNPGSAELQNLRLADGELWYERLAGLIGGWGETVIGDRGYSSIGAVVGATHPAALASLRQRLARAIFLVPGVGAQGAGAAEAAAAFDKNGLGALVTVSRSIIYAGSGEDYADRAAGAARLIKEDLWAATR